MKISLNIDGADYMVLPIPPPKSPTGLILAPSGVPIAVTMLDDLGTWTGEHDEATAGTATPTTKYPVLIGGRFARLFQSIFTDNGGARFHTVYGSDPTAKNFIYAGDLYFESVTDLAQMELDNNQVTADGKTYIFGCQCDKASGFWDVTFCDTGSHWKPTGFKGDPSTWPVNQWLHFEIACHRDDAGNITYDAIHFNGTTTAIGVTLAAALALQWTPGAMLVNFQLGGDGSGTINAYGSNLQIARW